METSRKRSAAVTLVLAGTLSGCGNPDAQQDVYTNLEACKKDWGEPSKCAPVADGRYSSSYFFGPRYYGSSFPSGRPRPSANALEATHAGSGGATHLAGNTVRSGFGSSARSMSSGG
jgi:hypothetical protein